MRHALLPRTAIVGILAAHALALSAPARAEAAPFRVPPGYRVVAHEKLATGVEHFRLRSDRPQHVIEVGVVRKGARHRVDVRHAGPRSHGPNRQLQGTSAMCGNCTYATNGDYAHREPSRIVGRPIGGIVERGTVLVSPSHVHQQASFTYGGGFTTQRLAWSARATYGHLALPISGKNVPRATGQLVLYTPDYVTSTGTNPHGAELTLRLPDRTDNLAPNTPGTATMLSFQYGRGNSPVRAGTVVLSGHHATADALRRLWDTGGRGAIVGFTETLAPSNIWASVGGGHILMRNGRRWFQPESAPHLNATHPRTFAGITKQGHLFHATVDGRDRNAGRSVGMPLEEALRFFTAFGAREVMNMDGGGSTTFVRRGQVVNVPSDGAERVVTTAMVVVPGRIPRRPATTKLRLVKEQPEVSAGRVAPSDVPLDQKPLATWVAAGNIAMLSGATLWVGRRQPRSQPSRWLRYVSAYAAHPRLRMTAGLRCRAVR